MKKLGGLGTTHMLTQATQEGKKKKNPTAIRQKAHTNQEKKGKKLKPLNQTPTAQQACEQKPNQN